MGMRVHELHPAVIHAPLVLLPSAAILDLMAVRSRDKALARVGRGFWIAGTVGGVIAGLSGLASSQEVRAEDPHSRDMMFLHGAGNTLVLAGAAALTSWRMSRGPSWGHAVTGLIASGLALYTAYLGGGMVYDHGVGIRSMPREARQGLADSPSLFSRKAPGVLARDSLRGARWLLRRAREALSGQRSVEPEATGFSLHQRQESAEEDRARPS